MKGTARREEAYEGCGGAGKIEAGEGEEFEECIAELVGI